MPVWNPLRRNRKIGTKASGHGQNNRMTIPEPWNDLRRFYERIGAHQTTTRFLGSLSIRFVIEAPREGWFHPCTPAEVCDVLSCCDDGDAELAPMIVLRQATRKQRILSPVWGRAVFLFELGDYRGPAIILEAQDCLPYVWKYQRGPEQERELERLRADGHDVRIEGKHVTVRPNPLSIKRTVLHRTLPHEVGHHVDSARLTQEEWDCRTPTEREDFAHGYAAKVRERLPAILELPSRVTLEEQLAQDGLPTHWFSMQQGAESNSVR